MREALDEFWRDIEACNRLSSPRRAMLMMRDLIKVRAETEQPADSLFDQTYKDKVQMRRRELMNQAIARGFPCVPLRHVRIEVRRAD